MNNELRITKFTDLNTWKESHKLVLLIYSTTKHFPIDERFGLTDQIRRAVVSITSNIAEGFSRASYKEKSQFYSMSLGSLSEVQNQTIIARDLKYISSVEYNKIIELSIDVSKLLNGLIKKTKSIILNS